MLGTFRCQGDTWGLYLKTRLPGSLKNMVSSHAACWSTNGVHHCQHHQWNMTQVAVWVLQRNALIWLLLESKTKQSSERSGRKKAFGHLELWWCQTAEQPLTKTDVFIMHSVSTAFNSQHLRGAAPWMDMLWSQRCKALKKMSGRSHESTCVIRWGELVSTLVIGLPNGPPRLYLFDFICMSLLLELFRSHLKLMHLRWGLCLNSWAAWLPLILGDLVTFWFYPWPCLSNRSGIWHKWMHCSNLFHPFPTSVFRAVWQETPPLIAHKSLVDKISCTNKSDWIWDVWIHSFQNQIPSNDKWLSLVWSDHF